MMPFGAFLKKGTQTAEALGTKILCSDLTAASHIFLEIAIPVFSRCHF